ncbi:MAG: hypothetical protein ACQETE_05680 [Bacteroidota bacterium]
MEIEAVHQWLMSLSDQYNVNPYIFAGIYVGAIPFFTVSLGWVIKNLKQQKPITVPALFTGFFFCSAYLYLMVAGENVPWWIYALLAAMVIYGIWSTYQKVRSEVDDEELPI